jgi:hypothetical protein
VGAGRVAGRHFGQGGCDLGQGVGTGGVVEVDPTRATIGFDEEP